MSTVFILTVRYTVFIVFILSSHYYSVSIIIIILLFYSSVLFGISVLVEADCVWCGIAYDSIPMSDLPSMTHYHWSLEVFDDILIFSVLWYILLVTDDDVKAIYSRPVVSGNRDWLSMTFSIVHSFSILHYSLSIDTFSYWPSSDTWLIICNLLPDWWLWLHSDLIQSWHSMLTIVWWYYRNDDSVSWHFVTDILRILWSIPLSLILTVLFVVSTISMLCLCSFHFHSVIFSWYNLKCVFGWYSAILYTFSDTVVVVQCVKAVNDIEKYYCVTIDWRGVFGDDGTDYVSYIVDRTDWQSVLTTMVKWRIMTLHLLYDIVRDDINLSIHCIRYSFWLFIVCYYC